MSGGGGGFGSAGIAPMCCLSPKQFDHLKKNYKGFAPDPARIGKADDPLRNCADRNWQDKLKRDSAYKWTASDQKAYKKNCAFGPHNAATALDKKLFKKK
jgi:hypothetical protein